MYVSISCVYSIDLEAKIETLRETQRKYNGILRLSSALASQLTAAAHTQRALGDAFADLAQKSPELQNQFVLQFHTYIYIKYCGIQLFKLFYNFNRWISLTPWWSYLRRNYWAQIWTILSLGDKHNAAASNFEFECFKHCMILYCNEHGFILTSATSKRKIDFMVQLCTKCMKKKFL